VFATDRLFQPSLIFTELTDMDYGAPCRPPHWGMLWSYQQIFDQAGKAFPRPNALAYLALSSATKKKNHVYNIDASCQYCKYIMTTL
jgi:hypothetical protein